LLGVSLFGFLPASPPSLIPTGPSFSQHHLAASLALFRSNMGLTICFAPVADPGGRFSPLPPFLFHFLASSFFLFHALTFGFWLFYSCVASRGQVPSIQVSKVAQITVLPVWLSSSIFFFEFFVFFRFPPFCTAFFRDLPTSRTPDLQWLTGFQSPSRNRIHFVQIEKTCLSGTFPFLSGLFFFTFLFFPLCCFFEDPYSLLSGAPYSIDTLEYVHDTLRTRFFHILIPPG